MQQNEVILSVHWYNFLYTGKVPGFSFTIDDIITSAKTITIGVVFKTWDFIPSIDQVFEKGKNMVLGYPFEVAFKIINKISSAALAVDMIKPSTIPSKMNFVLKYDKDYPIPLKEPERLWSHEKFNPNLPFVLFVTGWTTFYKDSTIKNDALDTVYESYRRRGGYNFVTIDSGSFVATLYSWSAFNTDAIGTAISHALEILIERYPIEKIHLIGHSLGAHIVGTAGYALRKKTGKVIPRITGLDPANPFFQQGQRLNGLNRGDAESVDIIHTNPGALGKRESIGDIDFYPNGFHSLPPGCFTITSAHARAWQYYAESVYPGNEHNFMACRGESLSAVNANLCRYDAIPMGFAAPTNVKGNYFLNTNKSSPYGKKLLELNTKNQYHNHK